MTILSNLSRADLLLLASLMTGNTAELTDAQHKRISHLLDNAQHYQDLH